VTLLVDVARTSTQVAGTASRLAKTRLIAERLRGLEEEEVAIAIGYLSGEPRQGKLAVGYATLLKCTGAAAAAATLQLRTVDAAFAAIKAARGAGAGAQRLALLKNLFAAATVQEQDFLVRLLVGELRQGALEGVMLDAVAMAADVPPAEVRRAATFAGAIAPVAQAALAGGASALARFAIRPLQPVLPMLAQPAEDVPQAMAQLGTALLEWKLDGARVQVHKRGAEVRVFTRSLNDVTVAVPEVAAVAAHAAATELILDGEAIALRPNGKPHPFQLSMRRFGRKADSEALRAELPLSVFFFDCLYRDGVPLVDSPALERRQALEQALGARHLTPALVTAEPQRATAFFEDALAHGHEGIIAKAVDAIYEAGRRGAGWLKIKHACTLDLVVLAAEWGHGRRRGWLSNLHLGARNPAGGFVMLGKTFKGLTDEMLEWQTRAFLELATERDEWTVHLRPQIVVEVAFNELQESPHYPGGVALRFARVKGYRPDKRPEEADTIDTVRRIFEGQGR
jgi:DNA ligase 1